MTSTAEKLIYDYANMDRVEQAKFDKRYRDLMRFRRDSARLLRMLGRPRPVRKLSVRKKR